MESSSIPKPKFGSACSGCGYCCATEPCDLAREFLHCSSGPCVALEVRDGRSSCGLVRNPLGYIFQAGHPEQSVPVLEDAPRSEEGAQLSVRIASALGLGMGCDSDDDETSADWSSAKLAELTRQK